MGAKKLNPYRPRRCKRCKLVFVPDKDKLDKGQAGRAKFCTRKCKDSYHRNGGMNIDRLHEVMTRRLSKELLADETFLGEIAGRVREQLGKVMRESIRQELAAGRVLTSELITDETPTMADPYCSLCRNTGIIQAPRIICACAAGRLRGKRDLQTELERVAAARAYPSGKVKPS